MQITTTIHYTASFHCFEWHYFMQEEEYARQGSRLHRWDPDLLPIPDRLHDDGCLKEKREKKERRTGALIESDTTSRASAFSSRRAPAISPVAPRSRALWQLKPTRSCFLFPLATAPSRNYLGNLLFFFYWKETSLQIRQHYIASFLYSIFPNINFTISTFLSL